MATGTHAQAYDLPAVDMELRLVRTNLAPRTIVRGPGFLNSVMISERIIEHVAAYLGADPVRVRRVNFLNPADPPAPSAGFGLGRLVHTGFLVDRFRRIVQPPPSATSRDTPGELHA